MVPVILSELSRFLDRIRRSGPGRAGWVWPAAVAVGWLLVQVSLAPSATLYPDSARYAQLTYQYLGADERTAHLQAAQLWCADRAEATARWNGAQLAPHPAGAAGVEQDCLRANADHFVPNGLPRYQAIFDSRPGYPLAAAVVAKVSSVRFALWAVPVGCVLLAGLGVYWTLRVLEVPPPLAAAGQAMTYLLPVGTWGTQALTEGPMLAGIVAAMTGGVLLTVGRLRAGVPMLAAGLGWTALVKYSTALPLAAALAVAAAAAWWFTSAHRRGLVALGAIGALGAVAVAAVQRWLSLPGFYETAQDKFTDHFVQPDVPDVMTRMIDTNLRYWERWPTLVGSNLLLLAGVLVGGWALWRRHRAAALVVLATASLGVALVVAHPEVNTLDRLYCLAWLAVTAGLPVAAWRLTQDNFRQPAQERTSQPSDIAIPRSPQGNRSPVSAFR